MVKSEAHDRRGGTLNMMDLIRNLHDKPEGQSMSDVTFVLDDETEIQAHKLILATASPYFEALFYGPFSNNKESAQKIEIKDVDADVFRIIIQTIYNSGRYYEVLQQQHDKADKFIAIMEAADMYLLSNLVDIIAKEIGERVENGAWENILPHLDRVSQLPLFAEVYKDIKKGIIKYLPEVRGALCQKDSLWEKLCPRVQADVIEDLEKIAWANSGEECEMYINLLRDIATTEAPFTELIDKINVRLRPLVQTFENKERFIKAKVMERIIMLDVERGQMKVKKAEILLKVNNLLETKSWEELCQSAFGDVVNLLEHVNDIVIDDTNKPAVRFKWEANVPLRYIGGLEDYFPPDWELLTGSFEDIWKIYSDLLEFAHKHSLPKLVDHCELILMDSLYDCDCAPENNALSYVIRVSGKKIFENIHKLAMFKVLSEFPQHMTSPDWLKLTETEILFIRDNYQHFKLATEDKVWTAIQVWCSGSTNDANEARDKYNRIKA